MMIPSPSPRFWLLCVTIFTALFGPAFASDASGHKSWDYPPFGANDIALYHAFQASCEKFQAMDPSRRLGGKAVFGTAGQWQNICREGLAKGPDRLEDYLNTRLTRVTLGTPGQGHFTGYYKPVLQGSYKRHGAYQTALVARPDDLVLCHGHTGRKLADGSCKTPYPTRAEIKAGIKSHNKHYKVLLWLKDPVDAYFLHIQGSGSVEMDDGTLVHVGFAGKNGHSYTSIGRVLRDMGELKGGITADEIRKWLKDNPARADEVLNRNQSFIFFTVTKTESVGAFGVVLTAGRSMAVDKRHVPLGLPLFVKTTDTHDDTPWNRIMFAQDIGSAIKGAARGDIYFGHGPLAGERAGDQNAHGTLWAMVPKENVGMQSASRKKDKSGTRIAQE